ncbi:MAG TPA: hypothetical protein VFI05_00315 [Nitrospiraceae bacterium]|nr:hypothetical protein [Nitrospiraceae bacterium]
MNPSRTGFTAIRLPSLLDMLRVVAVPKESQESPRAVPAVRLNARSDLALRAITALLKGCDLDTMADRQRDDAAGERPCPGLVVGLGVKDSRQYRDASGGPLLQHRATRLLNRRIRRLAVHREQLDQVGVNAGGIQGERHGMPGYEAMDFLVRRCAEWSNAEKSQQD